MGRCHLFAIPSPASALGGVGPELRRGPKTLGPRTTRTACHARDTGHIDPICPYQSTVWTLPPPLLALHSQREDFLYGPRTSVLHWEHPPHEPFWHTPPGQPHTGSPRPPVGASCPCSGCSKRVWGGDAGHIDPIRPYQSNRCPPPKKKTTIFFFHILHKTHTHTHTNKDKDKTRPLLMNPPLLAVENRDMYPRGGNMPGASPQSHDASGWGHRRGGIMSGLHPPACFLDPPPSPPTRRADNPPTHPRAEDPLLKRQTSTFRGLPAYSHNLDAPPSPLAPGPPPPPRPPSFACHQKDIKVSDTGEQLYANIFIRGVSIAGAADSFMYLALECMGSMAIIANITLDPWTSLLSSWNPNVVQPGLNLSSSVAAVKLDTPPAPSTIKEGEVCVRAYPCVRARAHVRCNSLTERKTSGAALQRRRSVLQSCFMFCSCFRGSQCVCVCVCVCMYVRTRVCLCM